MKLSKAEMKLHRQAIDILNKDNLTFDDKYFVYNNFYPAALGDITYNGAFFTPYNLARDTCLHVSGKRVIDLCAGIGVLSFIHYHKLKTWEEIECDIVCIERNWEYVKIGAKLFPEARWIHGSILDEELIKSLGKFDCVVSNPPFGKIKGSSAHWLNYKGSEFEYKAIEVGSHIADNGVFIIPQMSAPFKISGHSCMIEGSESAKYRAFKRDTGLELQPNLGIDCGCFKDEWKGTNLLTEVAIIDYEECRQSSIRTEDSIPPQISLF